MRMAIVLIAGAVALTGSLVQAQDYSMGRGRMGAYAPGYSPYPYYYEEAGSTPYGDYARGLGDLIRMLGQYNLDSSVAAINFAEAQRSTIENRRLWTQTYFDLRRVNREYRTAERGRRPTMEDFVRYAQMGKPQRMTPSELDLVTGTVNWPILLQTPQFASYRQELQLIFSERAVRGALSANDHFRVIRLASLMGGDLKEEIRQQRPVDYVAARRFLDSLIYEAGLPAG